MPQTSERTDAAMYSLYKSVTSTSPKLISLEEIYLLIRSDATLKLKTYSYRDLLEKGSPHAAAAKRDMSAFIVAATCRGKRGVQEIEVYTGSLMLDLDHLTDSQIDHIREHFRLDPTVQMIYRTVSGHGLRIIYRIAMGGERIDLSAGPEEVQQRRELLTHRFAAYYNFLSTRCEQTLGMEVDAHCKDASRLSFLSYDEEVYWNPSPEVFVLPDLLLPPGGPTSGTPVPPPSTLPAGGAAPIDEPKPETRARKGRPARYEKDPEQCLRDAVGWVQRQGVLFQEHQHNAFLAQTAYILNRFGVTETESAAMLSREYGQASPAYSERVIAGIVHSCYSNQPGEFNTVTPPHVKRQKNKKSRRLAKEKAEQKAEKSQPEVEREAIKKDFPDAPEELSAHADILRAAEFFCELRYNSFTDRLEARPRPRLYSKSEAEIAAEAACPMDACLRNDGWIPMTDRIANSLLGKLRLLDAKLTARRFGEAMLSYGVLDHNPVRDYFLSLPRWDGEDRARRLFELLQPRFLEEIDLYKYFLKWLVGLVRSAQGRPEYNELILLLVGAEGVGKTSFFKLFLPDALARYVMDQSKDLLDSKDTRLAMTSNVVIVVDEASSVTAAQFSILNQLATKSKVDERVHYGHHTEEHPRHASWAATANKPNFIRSPYGSRRYVSVQIGAPVDREALIALDKEQLFAQLFETAQTDFNQYLTHEEVQALSEYNLDHCEIVEEALLGEVFRQVAPGEAGRWFSLSLIFEKLVHRAGYRELDVEMLELVLRRRKVPHRETPHGWKYFLVLKDGCEIEREQGWNPYNQ